MIAKKLVVAIGGSLLGYRTKKGKLRDAVMSKKRDRAELEARRLEGRVYCSVVPNRRKWRGGSK